MGGQAEQITTGLTERWREGLTLSEALALAAELLSGAVEANAPARTLAPTQLEVAVLDRLRPRRAFRRLAGQLLERLLRPDDPTTDVPHTDERRPGMHDTLTGDDAAAGRSEDTTGSTQAQSQPAPADPSGEATNPEE
jgi:proteasome alpha subunit